MSISDSSYRGSITSKATTAAHTVDEKHRYLNRLDRSIAHLSKISLGGGRTGRGHESASSVAERLGQAGHVFCLLEKCFIRTRTNEEGLALFATEMASRLRESWKGHYAGKADKLESKIEEVITTLLSNAGPYASKLSRRAEGFKHALGEVGSKGVMAVADENNERFQGGLRNLEERVLAFIRHRSEGSSMETTRLVSAVYEGYGAAEIATGGPLAKLHKLLCKAEMKAANPREIHFMLVRNLAERLHKEKGYTPEDANRKAFHIVQELFKRGKDETAAQFDYIQGYIEAVGVHPSFIRLQRDLVVSDSVVTLLGKSGADASVEAAHRYEMLSVLRKGEEVNTGLITALAGLGAGTSSAAIVDRITANPALVRNMILTCLSHAGRIEGDNPVRLQMTEAIAGGFRSHFVDDGASVLRSVITAGRKPIEEKLGKVGESFMEYVTSKFSDEELLDMYKEVKSLNSAAEKSLTAEDRVSLEKWALDQGVAKAQGYEAAWAGLEALIDRYMNKKSRGSYQSAEVVMAAVFGDSPEIGAELVGGYYGVSDETSPQAFQLEFYHRMQGILARKDEDYYFRGSDTEAGNRKTKDLFSEFMKKLGVNDLSTLANVPYAVGATRHLSKYEGLRRTALREKAVAKVPARHVEEVRRYIAAQEMARASVATDAGSMIGFDTSVLGEYGFSAEPRFVLERRDSVESRLSSRSAFDLSEGFEARTEVAATGGGVRTPASIGALPAMPEVLQDETELVSGSGTPRSGASTPLRRVSVDSEDPVSLGDMVIPALDALGETLAAETAAVEEHGSSHPKPDLARSNLMAAIRQRKPAEEEVRPAVTAGEATARETGVAATAREVDASETRPVDTSGEAAVAEPPTQGVQRGFLADIRKGGFKLKSTKKPSAEAPGAGEDAIAPAERPPVRAPAADPRSGLLSAIRGGEARLKALPEEDPRMKPKPGVSSGKPASLQDIMRQAMQTRRGMLGEGRAGEDSDSDSDSDWSGSR